MTRNGNDIVLTIPDAKEGIRFERITPEHLSKLYNNVLETWRRARQIPRMKQDPHRVVSLEPKNPEDSILETVPRALDRMPLCGFGTGWDLLDIIDI